MSPNLGLTKEELIARALVRGVELRESAGILVYWLSKSSRPSDVVCSPSLVIKNSTAVIRGLARSLQEIVDQLRFFEDEADAELGDTGRATAPGSEAAK